MSYLILKKNLEFLDYKLVYNIEFKEEEFIFILSVIILVFLFNIKEEKIEINNREYVIKL